MPIHDWARVPSGLFHHFHQDWSIEITRRLNRGLLPKGLSALVEQRSGTREADVLTVERVSRTALPGENGGMLLLERPKTQIIRRADNEICLDRANRVVVRHHLGRVVAIIEIVSPGNKDSRPALRDFVEKTVGFLKQGIHVLIIDLFPPTPRDPLGIHKAIWDEILEEGFIFPAGKDRILVSYETGIERAAYIETMAIGEELPDMPLFLAEGIHIRVPLESTYLAAWEAAPAEMRHAVETGIMPEPDID